MLKPLELAIGLRYTRAKRRNHFISFISLSSVLGIALGVTALITVLSVMNGFEKELRARILGMAAHGTIATLRGSLPDWPAVAAQAIKNPEVKGVAPYVVAEAMITHRGQVNGAIIRGVLPSEEPNVSEIGDYISDGSLSALAPGGFTVFLGRELARRLGARTGDKVTLVVPQANVTPMGMVPRFKRFTVAGVFEVGHAQYDTGMALVHLADAQVLLRMKQGVSGVRLKVDELYAAPRISREVAESLGGRYWVTDWTQHHATFFRALKTEKTVMFIILTLIIAVAAFNIVSTLVMVVTDKRGDIAILRTLGLSPGGIMRVFIVQGTVIGLVGTIAGAIGGVLLATNVESIVAGIESLFGTKFLAPDIYYISDVPSDMRWRDVGWILSVAFVMSILATIYPAWRASRTEPAEALRYE
ncbi:MAG: lipoprotein-releasing ABC transporter permease subunit [Pseudomonadota bacterium]